MNPQTKKYTDPMTQPGYTKEYGYNTPPVIPISTMVDNKTAPQLPTQPQPTMAPSAQALFDANNQILSQFQLPTQTTQPTDTAQKATAPSWLEQYFPKQEATPVLGQATEQQNILNEKLAGLNTAKSRLAASQAKLQGVQTKAQADLLAAQNAVEGRGVTAGGFAPTQASIQRTAAINALALEPEILASQAQVAEAQGDAQLASQIYEQAQSQLNKVWEAKKTDQNNLYNYKKELFNTFLQYADKEDARLLTAKNKELDFNQQNATNAINNAQDLARTALSNGQSTLASQLNQIPYPSPSSKTFASDLQRYNEQIADIQAQIVPKTSGGGAGGNQATDNERALMTQFRGEQIVKDYNEILSQKGTIDAYIQNGVGGPADLALVFSFMKGLDPTSVVREAEYETAAKSGNIFKGAFAKFNGYFKDKGGFLPENVRQEFQNLVNQKLAVKESQYTNVVNQYKGISERQGLNPQNVIIDYSKGAYTPPTVTTQTETPVVKGFWKKVGNFLWGND